MIGEKLTVKATTSTRGMHHCFETTTRNDSAVIEWSEPWKELESDSGYLVRSWSCGERGRRRCSFWNYLFYLSESILLLAGTIFSENGAIR